MRDQLESFEGYQARGVDRCHVLIETLLRVDGATVPFSVLNISTAGFMGECEIALLMGTRVEIALASTGFVPATIRWALGSRTGIQFAKPLTLDECRRAILPDPETHPL